MACEITGVGVTPSSRWMIGRRLVGRQHLERRPLRRRRERVRVLAHEQRPVDALGLPVVADRLRDRQDVRLGERAAQRRAAMPAGAEAHALRRVGRIGPVGEIRLFQRPRSISISVGAGLPARG